MKLIKLALIALLSCFLLTACITNQSLTGSQSQAAFDRQQHEPDEFKQGTHEEFNFYVKRGPWDSPFNPHEVLKYWIKLDANPAGPQAAIAVVGNPKMDWTNRSRIKDPTTLPIPEGEIATAVLFVFVRLPNQTVELAGYGYRDSSGIVNFYQWNNEAGKYVRSAVRSEQSSIGLNSDKDTLFYLANS